MLNSSCIYILIGFFLILTGTRIHVFVLRILTKYQKATGKITEFRPKWSRTLNTSVLAPSVAFEDLTGRLQLAELNVWITVPFANYRKNAEIKILYDKNNPGIAYSAHWTNIYGILIVTYSTGLIMLVLGIVKL